MGSFADAKEEYEHALKLGRKEGELLPALDEILEEKKEHIVGETPLGLVQIPIDLIVGTRTDGRSGAFSKSFYPLLSSGSEFGVKWTNLYMAHVEEGIREPIKAYEYMGKYYVQEGNKRVSVLRYCGAVSVPGTVTRLVPKRTEEPENVIYYEYMDFYALSGVNYIMLSKPGSFARLQSLVGKRPDETWSDSDKLDFSAIYTRFSTEYAALKKTNQAGPGDAFLCFIGVYDYKELLEMTSAELKSKIELVQEEFPLLTTTEALELQMDPAKDSKNIVSKFFSDIMSGGNKEKVAFLHQKTAESSGWTYNHELGRHHVDTVFEGQIPTKSYFGVTAENADEIIKQAIEDGSTIIFTTAPPLLRASLKAAIEHPEIKIMNCSLNTSHKHIRTYYARMYEAKFLMGAIAGAMTPNDKIGYVANYPIYGMTANINAFALGAKMVNPRAKIYLEWSTVPGQNIQMKYLANDVQIVSGPDFLPLDEASREFGLYRATNTSFRSLAMPVWNWGKFYEKMIRNIINGSWKQDEASSDSKGLNYWWGMSADMIDVLCSHHLPIGTARLIELLRKTICSGDFNPFSGVLYSQTGVVQKDPDGVLSPEEIIRMDWLAENVIGYIPKPEEIEDEAKAVVSQSGLDKIYDDTTVV